ncbi:MAG: helix-turn-helix transcriptional regulator [Clostridia bacterium]|nr:helix-turn-helix transcriptional regulator [Clostridia bacterium]
MKILVVERIKYLMEAEDISQYALAKKLGISQSTICNWLNGKKEPSIESLWKLADYFGESVDYIIGRDNQ